MFGWNLKHSSLRPIALDIGHSHVKMVQLQLGGGRTSVVAACKAPIDAVPDDNPQKRTDAVVEAVRQMLARNPFHGRNVVSHLPNSALRMTSLRLQESDPNRIMKALAAEAADRFGLSPDVDIVNYLVAGAVRQNDDVKNELIVIAAADDAIRAHIEMLERAQLRPVSIDTIPTALFRGFTRSLRRQEDKQRTAIFVDIGARYTSIVFGRAGEINFIKQVKVGVDDFDTAIAERLDIQPGQAQSLRAKFRRERSAEYATVSVSDTDRLLEESTKLDPQTRQAIVDSLTAVSERVTEEISLCLRYYTVSFRGKRVERAWVSGGGAYETILLNVLKRKLAVEVDVAYPLRGCDTSGKNIEANLGGDRRGALSEWAVAVGLGLKGCSRTRMPVDEPEPVAASA